MTECFFVKEKFGRSKGVRPTLHALPLTFLPFPPPHACYTPASSPTSIPASAHAAATSSSLMGAYPAVSWNPRSMGPNRVRHQRAPRPPPPPPPSSRAPRPRASPSRVRFPPAPGLLPAPPPPPSRFPRRTPRVGPSRRRLPRVTERRPPDSASSARTTVCLRGSSRARRSPSTMSNIPTPAADLVRSSSIATRAACLAGRLRTRRSSRRAMRAERSASAIGSRAKCTTR